MITRFLWLIVLPAHAALDEDMAAWEARRRQLEHAAFHAPTESQREILRGELESLTRRWLINRDWQDGKTNVIVRPGDSLSRVARRLGVTVELLRWCNGLTNDAVRPGDVLVAPVGPVELIVDKSDNTLQVWIGGRFYRQYRVATGRDNCTPTGTFTIVDRVEKPTWWRPLDGQPIPFGHPEHELGTHWLAWDLKGYGIHGTNRPETIGTQASLGCVRMLNEDVAEVYALSPVGTRVTVRD